MFGNDERKIEDMDLDELVFVLKRELNRRIENEEVEVYDLFVRSTGGAHYNRQNARWTEHKHFLRMINEIRSNLWDSFTRFCSEAHDAYFDDGFAHALKVLGQEEDRDV